MKVDKKDLEELYDLISELFSCTDEGLSEIYYWDLQERLNTIKAKIEAKS